MKAIFHIINQSITDIFSIMREEFRRIFNDSGVLLLFVVAIIAYPLIYTFVYDKEVVNDVPIAVIDHSDATLSRQYINMLDATQEVKVAYNCADMAAAQQLLYQDKIHGIVSLPDNFSSSIKKGEQCSVNIFADVSSFIYYKQLLKSAQTVTVMMGKAIQINSIQSSKGVNREIATAQAVPLDFISIPLYNPVAGYATYLMPAILLLILQQILLMGIGLLGGTMHEQQSHSYLLAYAEKRRGAMRIAIGKGLAYFLIFLVAAFYLLVVVFKIGVFPHRTPLPTLLLFITPYITSIIFVGLFMASFFKNRENALLFLLFTSIPLLFLSGFSWPEKEWSPIFEWMSYISPSTWGIKGFIKLSQMGSSFNAVMQDWIALWIITLFFFIGTSLRFKVMRRKK